MKNLKKLKEINEFIFDEIKKLHKKNKSTEKLMEIFLQIKEVIDDEELIHSEEKFATSESKPNYYPKSILEQWLYSYKPQINMFCGCKDPLDFAPLIISTSYSKKRWLNCRSCGKEVRSLFNDLN